MPISYLSTDDQWQSAMDAILGSSTPDIAPLVRLLRSPGQIPAGVRHMIAEMMDPDPNNVGGYLGFRLDLRKVKSVTVMDGDRMAIAVEYFKLFEGRSANGDVEAAKSSSEDIGAKYNISGRTVERYAQEFREWREYSVDWINSQRVT